MACFRLLHDDDDDMDYCQVNSAWPPFVNRRNEQAYQLKGSEALRPGRG